MLPTLILLALCVWQAIEQIGSGDLWTAVWLLAAAVYGLGLLCAWGQDEVTYIIGALLPWPAIMLSMLAVSWTHVYMTAP